MTAVYRPAPPFVKVEALRDGAYVRINLSVEGGELSLSLTVAGAIALSGLIEKALADRRDELAAVAYLALREAS